MTSTLQRVSSSGKFVLGLGLGVATGWAAAQQVWLVWQLSRIDVQRSLATHTNRSGLGLQFTDEQHTVTYDVSHTIEAGIERISYRPKRPRFKTPILMQHGMWHGAWCWHLWQALLAEWGWESHAISLPGHGGSPVQRPIPLCTLDYYLGFLKAEIDRLPRQPILMGHSMGGALTQWYLKYVGDDLPAAVLVAPWVSHSTLADGLPRLLRIDPMAVVRTSLAWWSNWVYTPRRAAAILIGTQSVYSPEELFARLGPESALVVYQHNPPFWSPPANVQTPLLWLTGEQDAVVSVTGARRSAEHYSADFVLIEGAAHNLMMEHNYRETAEIIRRWLIEHVVEA